jgi:hypothetical protein
MHAALLPSLLPPASPLPRLTGALDAVVAPCLAHPCFVSTGLSRHRSQAAPAPVESLLPLLRASFEPGNGRTLSLCLVSKPACMRAARQAPSDMTHDTIGRHERHPCHKPEFGNSGKWRAGCVGRRSIVRPGWRAMRPGAAPEDHASARHKRALKKREGFPPPFRLARVSQALTRRVAAV